MSNKPLSRRTFLQGSGVMIALPFLEAMIPSFARAAAMQPKRFISVWAGTCMGSGTYSLPSSTGPLGAVLPPAFQSLAAIRQHLLYVSGLDFPVHTLTPTEPGSAQNGQHGFTLAPCLAGISSHDSMPIAVGGQTADQYAAAVLGVGTKFPSIQARVQAMVYNGTRPSPLGTMSARSTAGGLNALDPIASPLQLYNMLFSGFTPPAQTPAPTATPMPTPVPTA